MPTHVYISMLMIFQKSWCKKHGEKGNEEFISMLIAAISLFIIYNGSGAD